VHTAAVPAEHPELAAARAAGVPVITRSACLVQLMMGARTVAVAGSHGKSSTTWMLGHLLVEAGADPVVMVGGSVASLGGGARVGKGDLFVAETDESDGSFALVSPDIAVLTNLDREHLRHYGGDFARLENAFHDWLARIPALGAAVIPVDGLGARVTDALQCRLVRCGLEEGDCHVAGLELGPDGSRCRLIERGEDVGELRVPIPGAHMVLNAVMAAAAARLAVPGCAIEPLGRCERVRRRFTVHGEPRGVRVVEDYGHHPAEIRATIAAARLGGGRVHVLFQPHRYSRTADCFDDFVAAFDQAHAVAFLPIYAASEAPIASVSAERLAEAVARRRGEPGEDQGTVARRADAIAGVEFLVRHARPGDTCLILGAGDVGALAPTVVERLEGLPRGTVTGRKQRRKG
jgi:UDP-N-acetylmuramate--alanine ligase